jgi:hypothetical protein
MDSENQVEDFVADAAVNASASEPVPKPPASLDRQAFRRKRIDDYRDEGLSRPIAGEACLTSVSADLHGIASGIGQALNESLTETTPTLETIDKLEPTLNNYLRVTRQLERLTQFEAKMVARRRYDEEMKMKLQLLALQDHLQDSAG